MNYFKKGIAFLLVLVTIFSIISCTTNKEVIQIEENTSTTGSLQILNSEIKFTQEQVLSQIKADLLKENNGYTDTDKVIVMINLNSDALIDKYLDSTGYDSVAEYANTKAGQNYIQELDNLQDALIKELEEKNLITSVKYQYQVITNSIACEIEYKNLEEIENLTSVKDVNLSETYNQPQATSSDSDSVYDVVVNLVDVYDTGIYKSDSVSYTGKGTSVAILDSGFDLSHEVFERQPDCETSKLMFTEQTIASYLSQLNASDTTPNLDLMDVYYSKKIPYVYDYADKDTDVFPYDSEHGTHVAGIIGGYSDTIKGVAVDTQLVLMKVFPDLDDGGKTEDILAALEDAVLLGVDCINLSLGSSCGFSREADEERTNEVYDKIAQAGISCLTAASNSYSAGFGGSLGNTNKTTNPDSGTVGSPSTYPGNLSVASISGVKSKYLIGNDETVVFFKESNSIAGEENNFYDELYAALGKSHDEDLELEYVTVPGVGVKVNYSDIDVKGKIALVRRGDSTFEDKALQAKNAGAIACIIYNNIDGDILMSMGKTDHIPTISISKSDGELLAEKDSGTIKISYSNEAGPFMSDFSSWGPTPSLELKPEITAHGGDIYSSIPGGKYDHLSGTSMATPNLCGVMVLIRQFLKEKYPDKTPKEINALANEYLMSTATIALNQEGIPYSPRKQGAGLASLKKAVTTNAYITTYNTSGEIMDKAKLELYDDPDRTGVYNMSFNIINTSDHDITYDLSIIGMTETTSTSDERFVREMDQLLNGTTTFTADSNAVVNGTKITVKKNSTARVDAVYTLSEEDKNIIDTLFSYGMYVEGYVVLTPEDAEEVELNVPFLAFYGNWLEAPMFDKTYYEVDVEEKDDSIDDEDKLQADYYATTPYGSYYYNYIIPLGTYLYDIDTSLYDVIPASLEHIAISDTLGCIDGISAIYAGLLRNAKEMHFTIVDKVTGEVIWDYTDYNATKSYSYGSSPLPYYDFIKLKTYDLGLVNNRQYTFKMQGTLDYKDGGLDTNIRNTFEFDFYVDNEAPVLKEVTYEKIYDKTLKKDRYYINMTIYDNHYAMSVTPVIFTSSSSYTYLLENPIPIYSERNSDSKVRFEITDFLEDICNDKIITSALAFSIDDYALNSNLYLCQLPGTKGEFKFTKDGEMEGTDLVILSLYEDEVIDLKEYLATNDYTDDKGYLSHLVWESSNENVATVSEGMVRGIKSGKATITVSEQLDNHQAVVIINVKAKDEEKSSKKNVITDDVTTSKLDNIRFSYAETIFAYSRAAQTSEIGETGSKTYMESLPDGLSFYPGEKVQLYYDLDPWYVEDKYEKTYKSSNPTVATVDEDGIVTGLKKGTTYITLSLNGTNLMAKVKVTIKSEFVIEDRTLVAYKGLGGDVVIPDDEGILYIGSFAFCLYDTDYSVILTDDDYDANKIPNANTCVTSVVIPKGVTEIQKYAFYNCSALKSVTFTDDVDFIREYAFYNDKELETIDFKNVITIGKYAFYGCEKLNNIDTSNIYAIGDHGFDGCTSLEKVDLTSLRNTGTEAFKGTTSLTSVVMNESTKLSYAMFAKSGIVSVDIYGNSNLDIPTFAFAKCERLEKVVIHTDFNSINYGAFSDCTSLKDITILGHINIIGEQAFYNCSSLKEFTLPNNDLELGNYCFFKCTSLEKVTLGKDTHITNISGSIFEDTVITNFNVDSNNEYYTVDGNYLTNIAKNEIIFAATGINYGDLVIDEKYTTLAKGSFCGVNIISLTITNPNTIINDYAFANVDTLVTVNFPTEVGLVIGNHAFNYDEGIESLNNLDKVSAIGDYAFANTDVKTCVIGEDVTVGEGAFYKSTIEEITFGGNNEVGLGAFQYCSYLKVVNLLKGNMHFGDGCFAYCISLKTIDLAKIGSRIEKETFYQCETLRVANLENVTYIGRYAFADCQMLAVLTLPKVEIIEEGAFARYDQYAGAPIIEEVTLPNTLTTLGDGAFLGCEALLSITIPESVTSYGDYLFAYCVNLEEVSLPSNLTTIGEYMFAGCQALNKINLDNVITIKDYAFNSCYELTTINTPKVETIGYGAFASAALSCDLSFPKLKEIGDYAFQNVLSKVIVCESLETIHEGAFNLCVNLEEFTISPNLKSIDEFAFVGCSALKELNYLNNGKKVNTGVVNDYAELVNGMLYITLPNNTKQLEVIPQNLNIETLEVQEGTVRIERYAGCENSYIKHIILPDSLLQIGNYAFYGFKSLEDVEFRSIQAPALEDGYNSESVLTEDDPGYNQLHNQYDLFGLELYYYNFVDLLGKNEPLKMILPANEDIEGYDSLPYLVYFGTVESSTRSSYNAKSQAIIDFVNAYETIKDVKEITLSYESKVNDGLTAYNKIKQNYQDFGYDDATWELMYNKLKQAQAKIKELNLSSSLSKVKQLQKDLNNLDTTFNPTRLQEIKELNQRINALLARERDVLDLTNYNLLIESYSNYINQTIIDASNIKDAFTRGE